ncbi:MAG: hypothetical protein ACE5IJ_05890 [Thermoplasmata archaeon]
MRSSYVGLAVGLVLTALVSSSMFLGSMLNSEVSRPGRDSDDDRSLRPENEDPVVDTEDEPIQVETVVKSDRLDFGYEGTTFFVIQTEQEW